MRWQGLVILDRLDVSRRTLVADIPRELPIMFIFRAFAHVMTCHRDPDLPQ